MSMRRTQSVRRWMFTLVAAVSAASLDASASRRPSPGGYVIEKDAEVASTEPGTHNGGGQTVGYSFFKTTPGLKLVFRKRALKPGSGIGYHEQLEDEIALRPQRHRPDDDRRKEHGGWAGHGDPHATGKLARPQADRGREYRDHDQLRTEMRLLTEDRGPMAGDRRPGTKD